MKIIGSAIFIIALLGLSLPLWAYEVLTHEEMSEAAAFASVLAKPETLNTLGLTGTIEDPKLSFPNSEGTPKTIKDLFRDGARFEDNFPRSLNHFFDPISGDALLPILAKSSPIWALEDRIYFGSSNNFSYPDARVYFHLALTLSSETGRKNFFGRTFQSLGQVIHHIQDMAQPQHTRLDQHLRLSESDRPDWFFENGSRYEKYTRQNPGKLAPLFGLYPPVNAATDTKLTTPRQFWTGGVNGDGRGIADFTNRNFVSQNTNFRGAFQNGQLVAQPNLRYPLPAPSPTPTFELANDLLGQATPPECAPPNNPCVMAFFANEVKDSYRPQEDGVNRKASTASIFDQDLELHSKTVTYPNLDKCTDPNNPDTCEQIRTGQIFSLNRFNFDAAHQFLIPRAVGYSAGLINYFFRGKITIGTLPASPNSMQILNLGDEALDGTFDLYYEAIDGSRQRLDTRTTPIGVITLPAAGPDGPTTGRFVSVPEPVAFPWLRPAKKPLQYTLVFSGKMGEEAKTRINPVGAVAAKVLTVRYAAPDVGEWAYFANVHPYTLTRQGSDEATVIAEVAKDFKKYLDTTYPTFAAGCNFTHPPVSEWPTAGHPSVIGFGIGGLELYNYTNVPLVFSGDCPGAALYRITIRRQRIVSCPARHATTLRAQPSVEEACFRLE